MLVATDLSAGADLALRAARRFLAAGGALRLVHVIPYPVVAAEGGATALVVDAELVARTESDLARVASAAGASYAVRRGHVASEVAQEAETFGADLVVVGSRGLSRTKRLLLGSVARSVARRSPVSVLVARSEVHPGRGPVVVATDFYAPSAVAGRVARDVAESETVHVVHAVDPAVWEVTRPEAGRRRQPWVETSVRSMLHAFNESVFGGSAIEHVREGRPVPALVAFMATMRPGLLVVGTHGGNALERAVFGSVAERLVERAPCDVLVVKEPAADAPRGRAAVAGAT